MNGEHTFKVVLERPFGLKVAGSTFGTFVAIVEEKGAADCWNATCLGDEFDQARMVQPGDALLSFTTTEGKKYSCTAKSHDEILDMIMYKLPNGPITVEFRRMEGQERLDFEEWQHKFGVFGDQPAQQDERTKTRGPKIHREDETQLNEF